MDGEKGRQDVWYRLHYRGPSDAAPADGLLVPGSSHVTWEQCIDCRERHKSGKHCRKKDSNYRSAIAGEGQRCRPRQDCRGNLELTTMALTKPIKGIIGSCLTPFDENGRINYKAQDEEINLIDSDCD